MIKAARFAAKRLLRDFGEVENLQVSQKSPSDFVSRADKKAEESIQTDLTEGRPNYGWLGEESGEKKGVIQLESGLLIHWMELPIFYMEFHTGPSQLL